jgi:hypothetical protein
MSFWKQLRGILQTSWGKLLVASLVLIGSFGIIALTDKLFGYMSEHPTAGAHTSHLLLIATSFLVSFGVITGVFVSIHHILRILRKTTAGCDSIKKFPQRHSWSKWATTLVIVVVLPSICSLYTFWLYAQSIRLGETINSLNGSIDVLMASANSSSKVQDIHVQDISKKYDELTTRLDEMRITAKHESMLPSTLTIPTDPKLVVKTDFEETYRVLAGETKSIGKAGIYDYDIIELHQNSTLTIPDNTTLRCNYLKSERGATIRYEQTSGQTTPRKITLIANNAIGINDLHIIANGADAPSQAGTGSEGGKGRDAVFGPWGRSSENGKPGGSGKHGTNGGNAPPIEIVVGYVIDESLTVPTLPLTITSQGGKGGTGQQGGAGGRGGGADGDRTAARGGDGGPGGKGGNGGNAASVNVQYIVLDKDGKEIGIGNLVQNNKQPLLLPGGTGGAGGSGGDGGQRGSGSIFHSGGDSGKPGEPGQPGTPGSDGTLMVKQISREAFEKQFK